MLTETTPADELAALEAEYFDQPAHTQVLDLARINQLRRRLGRLPVDARLRSVATAVAGHAAERVAEVVTLVAEGSRLYAAYLAKDEVLAPHRAYAQAVAKATHGGGMTPVKPLATMGAGGGPLLCDHCGKPIILEGGQFHGAYADAAWARRAGTGPTFADRLDDEGGDGLADWKSYVKGGMLVDVEVNGTLRIYHGYRGQAQACLGLADAARQLARDAVPPAPPEARRAVAAFLKHQFPDMPDAERGTLGGRVVEASYGFDPGIGVNKPEGA